MHFHFEWFSVILCLNAHELLAFVYIFVECMLPQQSPIANWVLHKRQCTIIDVIDRDVKIFLTTYFRTIPMADVNFTSSVTSLITCHHCISFTAALVICKSQRILKGFTSLVAQRVFTSMMRIMQSANQGLACRIPCCRLHSGLFSASAVNVLEAHEYMHAIQPCNTDLYCIVVTSWHCVLHRKLAIKCDITNHRCRLHNTQSLCAVASNVHSLAIVLLYVQTIPVCSWQKITSMP